MSCNCGNTHAPGCSHKNVTIEQHEIMFTNYGYPIDRFEETITAVNLHKESGDHDARYAMKSELSAINNKLTSLMDRDVVTELSNAHKISTGGASTLEERVEMLEIYIGILQAQIKASREEVKRHIVSSDHDERYATKWQIDSLNTKLNMHKSGSDHDYRYANINDVSRIRLDNQNLMKAESFTLTAPNGDKYMLSVTDNGELKLEEI